MKVSLPRDARYIATARLIAAASAREAGCASEPADAFAGRVEDAARTCLAPAPGQPHMMMAIELQPDALVVTIDTHVMRLTL